MAGGRRPLVCPFCQKVAGTTAKSAAPIKVRTTEIGRPPGGGCLAMWDGLWETANLLAPTTRGNHRSHKAHKGA